MKKQAIYTMGGINRDTSPLLTPKNFVYENRNIRLVSDIEKTTLSAITERGTKEVVLTGQKYIPGTIIGATTIGDYLLIFSVDESSDTYKDYIIRFNISGDSLYGKILYKGYANKGVIPGNAKLELGFSTEHPIETISYYENEALIKVYWTDNYNRPRVINILEEDLDGLDSTSFDFVLELNAKEDIIIEDDNISGEFPSGTIQYIMTYIGRNKQESKPFYVSRLYYIGYSDRGASPEDKCSRSFNISITRYNLNYSYIRIYSLIRTSINGTPLAKRVIDLKIQQKYTEESYIDYIIDTTDIKVINNNSSELDLLDITPSFSSPNKVWILSSDLYNKLLFKDGSYINITPTQELRVITDSNSSTNNYRIYNNINKNQGIIKYSIATGDASALSFRDTNTIGDTIDSTELLYKGSDDFTCGTLASKDGTLFMGDITLNTPTIPDSIIASLEGRKVNTANILSGIEYVKGDGSYYPYNPNLTSFKKSQMYYPNLGYKHFKYLETYRLGIQFLHKSGTWSDAIWINDVKMTLPPSTDYTGNTDFSGTVLNRLKPGFTVNITDIIQPLKDLGFIASRPLIAEATIADRECICQGFLCPTVYNTKDRKDNTIFAQSSWFVRPFSPFKQTEDDWVDRENKSITDSKNSRSGINTMDGTSTRFSDPASYGQPLEYRHNHSLPGNLKKNCEIQSMSEDNVSPCQTYNNNFENKYGHYYFVDQSIVTLHSPEIEFDDTIRNIDLSKAKLRIVGMVPITSNSCRLSLETSTGPLADTNIYTDAGFYYENILNTNFSRLAFRCQATSLSWRDKILRNNTRKYYAIYPWHKQGSIINDTETNAASLKSKIISNLRFSYDNYYFSNNKDEYNTWNAYIDGDNTHTGISDIKIFDSNEVIALGLKAPANSGLPNITYFGNIDKLLVSSNEYDIAASEEAKYNYNSKLSTLEYDGKTSDPIRISYKSTPHAVIVLNCTSTGGQRCLPIFKDGNIGDDGTITDSWAVGTPNTGTTTFWSSSIRGVSYDILNILGFGHYDYSIPTINKTGDKESSSGTTIYGSKGAGPEFGFLWLGELYKDVDEESRFGGKTKNAFRNNKWLIAGNTTIFDKINSIVNWIDGDTYYQRYDHIKTYPYSTDNTNSIVDILSFMCETHINIEGRYDQNRGLVDNSYVNPTNFNLLNPVYSQDNNFFTYRGLNPELNINTFPTSIIWSKTKLSEGDTDTWTNINMASIINADGDKGKVRAIRKLNNDLIVLQDNAISNLLFNSRTQLSTTEGIPVEIANSGKVDGLRYISNTIGCYNKWSSCVTPSGLYFIDRLSKDLYVYSPNGLINLSNKLSISSWFSKLSSSIWSPKSFNGVLTQYDSRNQEIMFITKDESLSFSESLSMFTSFYDYNKVLNIFNLSDKYLLLRSNNNTSKIWEMNSGDYGNFFNENKDSYVTLLVNSDPTIDKIFSNIEFRGDCYTVDNNITNESPIISLESWNEYQSGKLNLVNNLGNPSSLKRKFRIWRANIPRDKSNNRDRMRNPWLYLKLIMNSNKRAILYDTVIDYYI